MVISFTHKSYPMDINQFPHHTTQYNFMMQYVKSNNKIRRGQLEQLAQKLQELNPNISENYMVNSICVSDVYWTVCHFDIWRIKTNKTKQLSCASAASLHNTLAEPHPNFNTQQSKNNTAHGVVQQHSQKLLKVDILMPETCWVSKK